QLPVAAGGLGVALLIRDQLRIAELTFQLGEASFDLGDQRFHGVRRILPPSAGPDPSGRRYGTIVAKSRRLAGGRRGPRAAVHGRTASAAVGQSPEDCPVRRRSRQSRESLG